MTNVKPIRPRDIAASPKLSSDKAYAVGDVGPGGGMVFMTPHTAGNVAETYLEAALDDLGKFTWQVAMSKVETCSFGGSTDWRMPSKEELDNMYENRNEIGRLSPVPYWSSSKTRTSLAWNQNFANGYGANSNEFYVFHVRPVRAFS